MPINSQQNTAREGSGKSTRWIIAGFLGFLIMLILIAVIVFRIDSIAREAEKYPYQQQIEALWNDESLKVSSNTPMIRKPYTVYYRNNDGKWIYMSAEAERAVDPDADGQEWVRPDYPDAVRDIQESQTIVLLWLDASASAKVNGFKWTDGSIAYEAQLKMTVIDPTAHTRYRPVDFAKVLVNHKRDGLYHNRVLDSTDGSSLDAYKRIIRYFK